MTGQSVGGKSIVDSRQLADHTLPEWTREESEVGESELDPKLRAKLRGNLQKQGYEIIEEATLLGKSGIEHTFDLMAQRDDSLPLLAGQ